MNMINAFEAPTQKTNLFKTKKPVSGMIATMPKSGTWYNHYFYFYLDQLLQDKEKLERVLPKYRMGSFDMKETMNISFFVICHAICPGYFRQLGKYQQLWEQLTFYVKGFNYIGDALNRNLDRLDPYLNSDVKLIYLHRNPLDQAVSAFVSTIHHKNEKHRYYYDQNGCKRQITNVRDYFFSVGLEGYIKQYVTWKVMKRAYPDNILINKYEDLVRNPSLVFLKSLNHFGLNVKNRLLQEKIAIAMKLTSKDSLRSIENMLGHSLGDDQTDPNVRHVRDGKVGKWKKYFTKDDLVKTESILNKFDISLEDFTIE